MNSDSRKAVRQVLREAAQHEKFFDFSDAERLNWMIARAFQIGKDERDVFSNHTYADKGALLGELKQKRSKPTRQSPARAGSVHSGCTSARIARGNDHRTS